jgi:hypothetical protein
MGALSTSFEYNGSLANREEKTTHSFLGAIKTRF